MKTLTVVVVGAGIAGLSTALALAADGHKVIVLDAIKEFAEVGAGIRVPPNSCKLLTEWGVDLQSIKKEISKGNRFVSWKDKLLCEIPFADVKERFGAPYHFIHRADLVDAMRKAAEKFAPMNGFTDTDMGLGTISILTNSRVVEYDFHKPGVQTSRGEWYTGDLVIAADGIRSIARDEIIRAHQKPPNPLVDTGDVAYRILVPASPLLQDPDQSVRELVTEPWATHWMGPEGHAVGYPLREGELYNIIIDVTHRTDRGQPVGEAEWSKRADNKELVERFQDGWCPIVQRLCGMTGEYVKWRLAELERPLEDWVHPSGKVALLGDSAHPMMPYLAQGAAQVMEDAAALRAALFSHLESYSSDSPEELVSTLSSALSLYQSCRVPRTAYITRNTQVLQEWLHLYDGPAQEQRDYLMSLKDDESNPVFWASEMRRDWLFGWDARKVGVCEDTGSRKEEDMRGGIGGKGGSIPRLPPLPPPASTVYPGKNLRGRLGIVGY
ncbi:salicylate hydroxylase [Lentinula raphanica]|uniref:Salicylate hydroxylase n=1 Tax=Lentinula raphanica TaxID=153919 RepID=A0AA38PG28_9AGAR|nr:salicylate hydroxylase [Lentinula raphanica]